MDDAPNVELLVAEIGRYLAAVDSFRAEGCHPRWADEREEVAVAAFGGAGAGLLHAQGVTGRRRGGANDETV